jgi:ATP-dependent RNA helicase SUPV3L1/SUV3
VAAQVDRLGRTDGDIEALMLRIAGIRTWTYISQRPQWIADAAGWQERTRAIEDKLSDALHERLIQRFVDRRTASLVVRLRDRAELLAVVNAAGDVLVEGHAVGRLDGFRFRLDPEVAGEAGGGREAVRAVEAAALRGLRAEAGRRVARLEADGDDAFALGSDARITWRGAAVAQLIKGPEALRPGVEPLASELLPPELRERVRRRLARWIAHHLEQQLPAVHHARRAMLGGAARGLVYQVTEALGSLPRHRIEAQLAGLAPEDHQVLRRLGLRIGRESVFLPAALKPPAMALRALLWCVHADQPPQPPPPPGRVSLPAAGTAAPFYEAIGFRVLGGRAVRVDIVERLAAELKRRSARGPFPDTPELAALAGCRRDEAPGVLAALGYAVEPGAGEAGAMVRRLPAAARRRLEPRRRAPQRREDAASPFAHLKALMPAP